MSESFEFNFPESDAKTENIEPAIEAPQTETDNFDAATATMAQAGLPPKEDIDETPGKYTLGAYYQDDEIAKDILRNKYLAPWEKSPWDLWLRQARALGSMESTDELRQEWTAKFLGVLEDFQFVPGGRIMHGAGRQDIKTTLNNCYVVAIKGDSIQNIYQAMNDEAMTYKYGGGCGHDLSVLRPDGSQIHGTGGESCGPTGFMDLFSVNTNTIAQHGRRGANMQTLRVDHPDIEAFIDIKRDLNRVRYSNISVLLTHEFMQAVESDGDFDLRWNKQVYKTVRAQELWKRIITSAHASAEPGLLFWDTMRDYHNGEYCSPLASTNPCAEQPLPDGGCCNLGSINLERFVDEEGAFMMGPFKETVAITTRFLDNVIDYNLERHALPVQRENAINDRRIGLGILGLGDMFIRMRINYDSQEALEIVDTILREMRDTAYSTSIDLAEEKGSFPNFKWGGYSKSKFVKNLPAQTRNRIKQTGIRNVTILTVPPTGSGAIVAQVTSGIEPVFATSYKRKVRQNDGYGDTFREYMVYHPVVKNLFGSDRDLPEYVVTAHNIDPYFRVKMQGIIQQYIDSSISSTVNLPEKIPVDTVADIYLTAYKEGLKGITVYREGSRDGILVANSKEKDSADAGQAQAKAKPEAAAMGGEMDSVSVTAEPARDQNSKAGIAPPKPRLHPRHRQETTFGVTRRVRTGEGNLYITINEDSDGLCEVFTTIGKAGGLASTQAEAISRLISLALRSGVDAHEVVKQLKGISGPHPTWEQGRLILSTPDAIGQALDDYIKSRPWTHPASGETNGSGPIKDDGPMMLTPVDIEDEDEVVQESSASKNITTCPECGGMVIHESGCVSCPGCGYSRC
ncbi:MAG: adenosylcobalamin-dependent ribonucleoside-diphosphate reductase [Candidatus Marinimicrobia bacterium]|nr:adenosylcobalamin-dependent ribonucleoside-diphosphate reductase [Candidatus Neomarinimicrobiota bacterium]